MKTILCAIAAAAAVGASAQDGPQDADVRKVHARVYKEVAPGIVGVRDSGYRGTGILIHRAGWILTSQTALRPRTDKVQVYLRGHVRVEGRVVERIPELETILIKIAPDAVPGVIEPGDSDDVRVGRVCYTLGDSFDSIFTDDQVAMSAGVVSSLYELKQPHARSKYVGPVLETSAAVNPNLDGGALIDRDGRLIGMVTMNYDESRFAGAAIPINRILAAVSKRLRSEAGEPWLGWTLEFGEGGAVAVARVSPDGPAAKAGVKAGDRLARFGSDAPTTSAAYARTLRLVIPGDEVVVVVARDGKELTLRLKADVKEFY